MPTQAQIDSEQSRTQSHTGTIGIQVKSGGIHDLSTSFIVPKKEFPQTGKRPIQDDGQDFVSRDRVEEESSGGSGSGLPEYPGLAPSINIKAPLVWDGTNSTARWLQGTTQSVSDPKSYADVLIYDPLPSSDTYSLLRTESLEVIICKDGSPVTGNIFFVEADPQP